MQQQQQQQQQQRQQHCDFVQTVENGCCYTEQMNRCPLLTCVGITTLVVFSTRWTVKGWSISLLICLTILLTRKTQAENTFVLHAAWMQLGRHEMMKTQFCDQLHKL